jgi:hypothetical protein
MEEIPAHWSVIVRAINMRSAPDGSANEQYFLLGLDFAVNL